jgi:hypothetical protein
MPPTQPTCINMLLSVVLTDHVVKVESYTWLDDPFPQCFVYTMYVPLQHFAPAEWVSSTLQE